MVNSIDYCLMVLSQFQAVGRDLFTRGLVSSHSGNISVRMGDHIIITRRGSQLGNLQEQDLVETGIFKNDRFTPLASIELPVHRAIYQNTPALAVVHAHPPYAIALSMTERELVFEDTEDELSGIGHVPVIGHNQTNRPGQAGEAIAEALKVNNAVLVDGHGSFTGGQLLEEAYRYAAALEERCQVLWLYKTLKRRPAD
jgi:L-fuculose-phosphate aldolase